MAEMPPSMMDAPPPGQSPVAPTPPMPEAQSPIGGPEAQPAAPPPPGATAPATVAPPDSGLALQGRIEVSVALKMLTRALGKVGATTPDGVKLAKNIYDIGKLFGEADPMLEQQELKIMGAALPPVSQPAGAGAPPGGGGSPLDAAQQAAQSKLGALGLGGGAAGPMA